MRKNIAALTIAAGMVVAGLCLLPTHASQPADPLLAEQKSAEEAAMEIVEKIRQDDMPGMMAMIKEKQVSSEYEEEFKGFQDHVCFPARQAMLKHAGKPLGEVELIEKEFLGTSYARFVYLDRYERGAMTWQVDFYRTPSGWRLTGFFFDSKPYARFKSQPEQKANRPGNY